MWLAGALALGVANIATAVGVVGFGVVGMPPSLPVLPARVDLSTIPVVVHEFAPPVPQPPVLSIPLPSPTVVPVPVPPIPSVPVPSVPVPVPVPVPTPTPPHDDDPPIIGWLI